MNAERSWHYNSESPGPPDGFCFENSNLQCARTNNAWLIAAMARPFELNDPDIDTDDDKKMKKIRIPIYPMRMMSEFVNATRVFEERHLGSAENAQASPALMALNKIR